LPFGFIIIVNKEGFVDKSGKIVQEIADTKEKILSEVSKCIIGQKETLNQLITAVFSDGHCILFGLPGLAKTLMISSIAETLNISFNRIQFTPDLMPSDIVGTEIIEETTSGKKGFNFIKGPVFHNIILADEINRTPPKTQSALLQAMQEYKVTSYGKTYPLDKPFFVFATQNPIEQEGTYPLPEAQIDRFLFNIEIDYPEFEEELVIARKKTYFDNLPINPVTDASKLREYQSFVEEVPISDKMIEHIIKIVTETRPAKTHMPVVKEFVDFGAGPRASQYIVIASKVNAVLNGEYAVTKKNINAVLYPVLNHRIILNYASYSESITTKSIIEELINYAEKN
jgi:MoxR-like ATPase